MRLDARLQQLLDTHAATLAPLLGHLWPVRQCRTRRIGPHFTKYILGELRPGTWAMLHLFTAPDAPDAAPHDHPCQFESFGIAGSYLERIYLPAGGYQDVLRAAGGHHVIAAACIHKMLALPDGPCLTLALAGPVVRRWRKHPARLLTEYPPAGVPMPPPSGRAWRRE